MASLYNNHAYLGTSNQSCSQHAKHMASTKDRGAILEGIWNLYPKLKKKILYARVSILNL